MTRKPESGSIGWADLTVPDAVRVRDFYQGIAGWTAEPVDMGGYSDWVMRPGSGAAVAGICHKRDSNAALPPVWLIYVVVADLEHSIDRCRELGGRVLGGPHAMGDQGRYCVIEDPAGAACALYQPAWFAARHLCGQTCLERLPTRAVQCCAPAGTEPRPGGQAEACPTR